MRYTTLATVATAIGLLACADHTPTTAVDPGTAAFAITAAPPLFEDGFESGTLASWDDGANPTYHRVITDAALAHSGSRVLEVTYPANDNGSWLTKFIAGYQSVYVSYWVRFPDTWRGGGYLMGVYGSPISNKWAAHGKAGVCPTGRDFFTSFLFNSNAGDPGPVRFYTYHPDMPRSGTQCWGDEGAAGVYKGGGALSRGGWHNIEMFVQANTPGAKDGVQRMWVDGTLQGEWTGLRYRDTPDLVITSIQLATYTSAPVTQTQKLYIDDVVVREVRAPNGVASVQVTPATAALDVGASTQLVATPLDAAGTPVAGATVTWSSSNPSVAAVSPTGLVTAQAGGAADVIASAGGQSGRASITVNAPGGGGASQVVLDEGFEAGSFATWDDGYNSTKHRIVTDAGLAHSGQRYLSITYPAGGDGGWLTKFFMPGFDSVQVSYWVKFPWNWQGGTYLLGLYGSPIDNQWGAFGKAGVCPNGSDYLSSFLIAQSSANPGPTRFYSYYPGMPKSGSQCWGNTGIGVAQYVAPLSLGVGAWRKVDFTVRLNTPGQSDGAQRMWIDGVLRGEWTGLRFRDTRNLMLNAVQIAANVTGGSPQTQRLSIDDIKVTGYAAGDVVVPLPVPTPVASVSVVPTSGSVEVGKTLQFAATTRDAAGNILAGRTVTWTSSAPAVATVAGDGQATGVSAGAATIVATSEGKTGSAALTVTVGPPPPPAPVATITVTPATASVQAGQTVQLAATLRDAAGNVLTGRAITWSTSNAAIATVSSTGLVRGVAAGGPVTITATSEGRSATSQVTVTAPAPAPVATVTVAPATGSIGVGQTLQLAATLRDASGNVLAGRTITWTTSSAGIATVSANGLVTGVAAGGPVTIRATSEGQSGTASVTITAPPPPPPPAPVATVSISPATASLAPGQSLQLTPALRDAAGNLLTGRVITWTSSNLSIVTVAPTGVVMGVAAGGPVTITATSEGQSGTSAVTVTAPSTGTGSTLFESDWRTASGTGTTALRDGTKWTQWVNYGGPQLLSVVPASGMGFPSGMTNVLRVLQMGEQDAEHMQLENGLPLPQVGEHRYYRIYTRVDEAAQGGGSDHPVEPIPGSCPFLWTFKRSIGANGWTPQWQFSNTPSEEWWNLRVQLQKNTVYRIEWHFFFNTSSTFKFDTRIYDAAGTLLYTDVDFLSGNFLNQTLQARDPDFRNTSNSCFRHLFVGNNGQANWSATNTYTYWGGVKVCKDGWCGAY